MSMFLFLAYSASLITIGYALVLGSKPERLVCYTLIVWLLSGLLYTGLFGGALFIRIETAQLIMDLALTANLSVLSVAANRTWPLFAAAASLITISAHLSTLLLPDGMSQAYWILSEIPYFFILLSLLLGTLFHSRRMRIIGNYRSWRKS